MTNEIVYSLLFILIGLVALILGLTWKKPTYGGAIVHKFTLISVGLLAVIYGIACLV